MKYGRFLTTVCFGLLALCTGPIWADGTAPRNADLLRFGVKAVLDNSTPAPNSDGPLKVRRGQLVKLIFTGTPKAGFHTYPLTKRTARQDPAQLSSLKFGNVKGITRLWPITETPEPEAHLELTVEGEAKLFEQFKTFTWEQYILVTDEAIPGTLRIPITLDTQVCKDSCWPFLQEVSVALEITPEPALIPPEGNSRLSTKMKDIEVVVIDNEEPILANPTPKKTGSTIEAKPDTPALRSPDEGLIKDRDTESYKSKIQGIAEQIPPMSPKNSQNLGDLLNFILTGIFWGAISLVTPCVFPMIPITVSFFLKQSEKEHHRPIVMATVYSLTIVIVLTLAAAFLLSVFRWLSVHPVTNYLIGGLFIFFALSLFGMYEIELPNRLAQFTSAREGRGGLVGTIFMALTFTIISFACVAPFLGGFSGTAAAARPMWHNLLGGLAFSATFAAPFFFLALFPALLRKLPKSGSWLNSVKVVMGFLELAAAFKFFRSAELINTTGDPSLFTFDFVLGIWIALCVLCGLYLIGIFRLPHDSPAEHISVPRLLFSGAFLALALYLSPALFKMNAGQSQRPGGAVYAWIDSFLLPEYQQGDSEIPHTADLDYAVNVAREERKKTGKPKRIFIDFTGVTCTNCIKNERNVFTRPAIAKLFDPYLVVKIYTDTVPGRYYAPEVRAGLTAARSKEDAKDVNLKFQIDRFGTEQLPLYVILEPESDNHIRVIGMYEEGLINNVSEFASFLRNPDKYKPGH
jgi:thiol:disulfide interchange protein DsbD